MMYKELFITFSLVFFLLAVPIAFAVPGTWAGYARTDSSIAANGTIVSAINNNVSSTEVKTTIAGAGYSAEAPAGYYSISIEAGSGEPINFKICGIYVSLAAQSWSAGPHYNGTTPNYNLSISKSANGASCTYSCGCSGGYCCSGATQYTNVEGTGTCQASACTSPAGGTTGTTGTTGGGGGVTVVEVTKTITATPTSPAVTTIESDKAKDLKVDQVTVEVKETVTNAQITVKESSLPTGASVAISTDAGATYKYLDISTTADSAKISKVKIRFKVEKTWITNNNIDDTKIVLQRYASNQWNKLPTTKLATEDATYFYYEAESSGLSVFAITGEKKVAVAPGVPTECPVCPDAGDWSSCVENKHTRTNYRCSSGTNYACQSYTEEKTCIKLPPVIEKIIKVPIWIKMLVSFVILLAIGTIAYAIKGRASK